MRAFFFALLSLLCVRATIAAPTLLPTPVTGSFIDATGWTADMAVQPPLYLRATIEIAQVFPRGRVVGTCALSARPNGAGNTPQSNINRIIIGPLPEDQWRTGIALKFTTFLVNEVVQHPAGVTAFRAVFASQPPASPTQTMVQILLTGAEGGANTFVIACTTEQRYWPQAEAKFAAFIDSFRFTRPLVQPKFAAPASPNGEEKSGDTGKLEPPFSSGADRETLAELLRATMDATLVPLK